MPHVTAILAQEVGIQYQGVKDASSLIGAYPISGVIVGSFRRGRLDQPMTITRENIKAKLGYDPRNPDYIAVQDALDSGVPSVQVLRVIQSQNTGGGDTGGGDTGGEELQLQASPAAKVITFGYGYDHYNSEELWDIKINNVWYRDILKPSDTAQGIGALLNNAMIVEFSNVGVYTYWDSTPALFIQNQSSSSVDLVFRPHNPEYLKGLQLFTSENSGWYDEYQAMYRNETVRIVNNELVMRLSAGIR